MWIGHKGISWHRAGEWQGESNLTNVVREAVHRGVTYIEFDVRRTRDGILVVWHDEVLPSGMRLSEATWDQYVSEVGGLAHSVREVIFAGKGRVKLHVDLKEMGYERELLDLLLSETEANSFVITTLESKSIREIKHLHPEVRCGLSLGRDLGGSNPFRFLWVRLGELFPGIRVARCRADFLAVNQHLARVSVLRYCNRHGIPAWVWTVDDVGRMAKFMMCPNVEVVVTNRPRLSQVGLTMIDKPI
jgi:glycerophosphoryl diester phosphodiesterase